MFELTGILAWGSLIWEPKNLKFHKDFGWQKQGPTLPIEFARISKDGRLTLVISENETPVKTHYTLAIYDTTIKDVIDNLKAREGCKITDIGFYTSQNNVFYPEDFLYKEEIINWAKKFNIDNVVWTNLPEKWEYKNENNQTVLVNPNERIEYLKNLSPDKKELAEEYIRKAPVETKTKYRNLIEQELNWTPVIVDINPYFKEKIELENKLTFSKMTATGELTCLACKHSEIVSSYSRFCEGYQCQSCGKFHSLDRNNTEPAICDCEGKLERNKTVFCSKCKSDNVQFKMKYLG